MEKYIEQLERLAEKNLAEGGSPYSALIVMNGEVIATGVNEAHKTNDPTQHAELLALQKALKTHKPEALKDAVIYASGQPCPMCYAAAQYVGIKEIYYAVSKEQIAAMGKGAELRDIPSEHLDNETTKSYFEKW